MNRTRTVGILALGSCLLGDALSAQSATQGWRFALGLNGSHQITRSSVGSTETRFTGPLLGGEAAVMHGGFVARLRYAQGKVASGAAKRDVIEGDAFIGYNIRSWLGVGIGPHARTFVVPSLSDRRWLFWSGRLSARGTLFPGRVESFVEIWQGLTGTLSRPDAHASGGGLAAGLTLRLAAPLLGRLTYRFEQGRVAGGPRETFEAFALTIGYVH